MATTYYIYYKLQYMYIIPRHETPTYYTWIHFYEQPYNYTVLKF